ncbi:MAG: methyltransferase domain-containing protein [Burkholderiales bacterium]|jgi:SAM-dependent methyltransferase|nr:methyltransferase domain-containing protein [Burkholderiales bacterium]
MVRDASIIELASWLQTAPGQCLLRWEQRQIDTAVADVFGYHALQLGLPQLHALRANRMPHRWVATDSLLLPEPTEAIAPLGDGLDSLPTDAAVALHCDFDALPFPNQSLDLVVLPHALELSRDPHLTLREVERVLMPEGRVMILGFNPASMWGLRQRLGHARSAAGMASRGPLYLPRSGEFLGYWRLRDWLRLLSFEVEGGRFGCFRPPYRSARWLDRSAWMEAVGERWWPVFGAAYFLVAVKRVRGMRLVGLVRHEARAARAAPAVVANRQRRQPEEICE